MFVLILSNIIVIACASLLVAHFFKIKGLCDSILTAFMLFFAQIVLVGLIFGILGKLYLINIMIAHSLILFALYLVYKHKKPHFSGKPDIGPFINNNLVLFACSVFLAFFLISWVTVDMWKLRQASQLPVCEAVSAYFLALLKTSVMAFWVSSTSSMSGLPG